LAGADVLIRDGVIVDVQADLSTTAADAEVISAMIRCQSVAT
jgi:hypothetical protein